jgi:hypothetical protein
VLCILPVSLQPQTAAATALTHLVPTAGTLGISCGDTGRGLAMCQDDVALST